MDSSKRIEKILPGISGLLGDEHLRFVGGGTVIGNAGRSKVVEVVESLRGALFPGVCEDAPADPSEVGAFITSRLSRAASTLTRLVSDAAPESKDAQSIVQDFICALPDIRAALSLDIAAAYDGDPAARFFEEILLSYPGFEAVMIYRLAHILYDSGVPVIPRVMTEYAHQRTGIDIHPGARIGKRFFIDHGTGVVIGETCTIGDNVKMYQGVTLGARSFDLDLHGNPVKGIKRHPDIEDDVVIYAGATILGGDTRIGRGSVIGGNVWLTHSVPPHSRVYNAQPEPIIK